MTAKTMNSAKPEGVPPALRNLHESMVLALNEHLKPVPGNQSNGHIPSQEGYPGDISAYIGRIQRAGSLLQSSGKRIRDLEEALYNLKQQHAQATAQLEDAHHRCAELEQALALEGHRADEAESRADAAEATATELQQVLANTSGNLDVLTSTIESAFGGLSDSAGGARSAA